MRNITPTYTNTTDEEQHLTGYEVYVQVGGEPVDVARTRMPEPVIVPPGAQLALTLAVNEAVNRSETWFLFHDGSRAKEDAAPTPTAGATPAALPASPVTATPGFELCGFQGLGGPCSTEAPCEAHAGLVCSKCGRDARKECDQHLASVPDFLCCEPLCDTCTHATALSGEPLAKVLRAAEAKAIARQILGELDVEELIARAGVGGVMGFRVAGELHELLGPYRQQGVGWFGSDPDAA